MPHLRRFLAMAFLGAAGVAAAAASGAPPAHVGPDVAPRAVIISWDGAKPDVLQRQIAQGRLPGLKALIGSGCWTWDARTIVPSLTLPSHVSMLTGVPPSVHGVTWNSDRPEKGPLKVSTVFSLAKAAGLETAMVVGKTKLNLLAGPGGVDSQVLETRAPKEVTRQAIMILEEADPDLLFVHFAAPDAAGHDFGWGDSSSGLAPSPEYEAALRACDKATAKLIRLLQRGPRWRATLLILTADHGGRGKDHGSEDTQETRIPWVAAGGLVAARGELKVPVITEDTAATAVAALGIAVPSGWAGKPVPGVLAPRTPETALKPAA